jgi:hypothetical protein
MQLPRSAIAHEQARPLAAADQQAREQGWARAHRAYRLGPRPIRLQAGQVAPVLLPTEVGGEGVLAQHVIVLKRTGRAPRAGPPWLLPAGVPLPASLSIGPRLKRGA